jgi:hypothetical protein
MKSAAEIDALADDLTAPMRHVLMRCSDAVDWTLGEKYATWPREWPDVVAGRKGVSFNGSVRALERRGLVEIESEPRRWHCVRLTRDGVRVQAALRLQRAARLYRRDRAGE